jgi:hypothetical protein
MSDLSRQKIEHSIHNRKKLHKRFLDNSEAINVAIEMGGGPAGAYARFALNALDYFKEKHKR